MNVLRFSFASAALLLVPVVADAQTRWIHVRVHEKDNNRARVSINLPLRSAIAMTRAITSADGRFEISGVHLEIDTIASGWRTLRDRAPDEQVSASEFDSDLTFVRTAEGMTVIAEDRWSKEQSRMTLIAPLLDLLTAGDLADHAMTAALRALPSGVPALRANDEDGTLVAWVDEWPEGALP